MRPEIPENKYNLLPPADWAGEIERLQNEINIERDRNLRTLADFKNYRRRIEHDNGKLVEEGQRAAVLPLLEIIDDLEKALQWSSSEGASLVEGVRIIHQKFLVQLKKQGIVPFDSVGAPFDHTRHDAVAIDEIEEGETGMVIDELRCGYLLNNKVLRPAQVRVAK